MRKFLLNVNDHPDIKKHVDQLDEASALLKQQISFMEKQAKNICDEANRRSSEIWEEIHSKLKVLGKIPNSYSSRKGNQKIQIDGDSLDMSLVDIHEDNETNKLANLLRDL